MANVAHPGFAPVKRTDGSQVTYQRKRVLTNNTTQICLNDACITTSAGDVTVQATGTTFTGGVSGGASYLDANSQRVMAKSLPAATLYTSTLVDPYNASYVFLTEGNEGNVFRASVDAAIGLTNLNINHAITLTAGTNGISGHELTASGAAVTATIPWRVTDFVMSADSDPDAAHAHVYCRINAGMIEPAISLLLGT